MQLGNISVWIFLLVLEYLKSCFSNLFDRRRVEAMTALFFTLYIMLTFV